MEGESKSYVDNIAAEWTYRVNNPRTFYDALGQSKFFEEGSRFAQKLDFTVKSGTMVDMTDHPFQRAIDISRNADRKGPRTIQVTDESSGKPIVMTPQFSLMPDPRLAKDFGGGPVICVCEAAVDSTTTFVDANTVVFDLSSIIQGATEMFTGSLISTQYARRFTNAFTGILAKQWTQGTAIVVHWQLENSTQPVDAYDGITFHFSVSFYGFGVFSRLTNLFGESAPRHHSCYCDDCLAKGLVLRRELALN